MTEISEFFNLVEAPETLQRCGEPSAFDELSDTRALHLKFNADANSTPSTLASTELDDGPRTTSNLHQVGVLRAAPRILRLGKAGISIEALTRDGRTGCELTERVELGAGQ